MQSREKATDRGSNQDPPGQTAPNGWPKQLLRGFREGEPAALAEVYRRYAPEVAKLLRHGFRFSSGGVDRCFVGLRSPHDFQDTLHESFRRAFEPRARTGYDGLRPYGAYVCTIARNLVLQSFRSRERLFPEIGDEQIAAFPQPFLATPVLTPELEVHDQQVKSLVRGFLEQLSEEDRAIVRLRFQESLGQREAAARLNLGRQRLRGRELAIRRALLRYLEQMGEAGLLGDSAGALCGLAWLVQLGESLS